MPPITSPRRTVLHSPPAPLRAAAPVPIPGAPVPPLSSSASTFASTPPSAGTSLGTSLGSTMASAMGRTLSHGADAHSHGHAHHGHGHGTPHSLPHSHSHMGPLGHAPYMVALAGWPEPLFVAEREPWDVRKRSRPTTPTGFRGEVRDGVACPLPASLVNAGPTNGLVHPQPIKPNTSTHTPHAHAHAATQQVHSHSLPLSHRRSRPGSPTGFPTSSARDAPPDSSSASSTPPRDLHGQGGPLTGPLARLALGDRDHPRAPSNATTAARTVRRHIDKLGGFSDPRYNANAAVVGRGRSLRVAPAWSSSGPPADRPASGHGRGWPIARAVPEVWPPPGVITQVYPRDPDTLFFARGGSGGSSGDEDEPASKAARTVVTEAKREREASHADEKDEGEKAEKGKGMDVDR